MAPKSWGHVPNYPPEADPPPAGEPKASHPVHVPTTLEEFGTCPHNSVLRMSLCLGTWVKGTLHHPNEAFARRVLNEAFDVIKRLEVRLTRFVETSVISQINREAYDHPVTVDPEIFDLLEWGWKAAAMTRGAVDLTSAPLTNLWRKAETRGWVPAINEIDQVLQSVGYEYLHLDRTTRSVQFLRPGMQLDLGAFGKGYILDQTAAFIKASGITNGMLDAGGNILCFGEAPSLVGIRHPLESDEILSTVTLQNEAVSTSANDERFYRIQNRSFGHLLDPRTGVPIQNNLLSVSVVARSALVSDFLSSAYFVMGPTQITPLASQWGAHEVIYAKRKRFAGVDLIKTLIPVALSSNSVKINTLRPQSIHI